MATHLNPAPVSEPLPETSVPAKQMDSGNQLLQEVVETIVDDCRTKPERYLEEVRVAVSGE